MRAAVFAMLFLFAASARAFSPDIFVGSLDETFYSQKGPALRISYSSFDVLAYSKIMGAKVPSSLRLNNLRIFVEASNITDAELSYAKMKAPFNISAKNFSLCINGRKRRLTIASDGASLTPINTVVLHGNVRVFSATGEVKFGQKASLSLEARTLFLDVGDSKIAFKF